MLRRVHAAGDFAVVVARGDAVAGSVVLVHRDRGGHSRALVRSVGPAGAPVWSAATASESIDMWLERQRRYDPDLWIIELDTPDPARFVDEPII